MGIERSCYAGPAIRISRSTTSTEVTVLTCPKTDCQNHKKPLYSDFCEHCGSKREQIIFQKDVKISAHYIREELAKDLNVSVDLFSSFGCYVDGNDFPYVYLFKNRKADPGMWIGEEVGLIKLVDSSVIETELADWTRIFAKEIEYLKGKYEKVDVVWGIFGDAG